MNPRMLKPAIASCVLALTVVAGAPTALAQTTPTPMNRYPQPPPGTLTRSGIINREGVSPDFLPDRDTPDTIRRFGVLQTFAKCATGISGGAIAKALQNKPMSPGERRLVELQNRLAGCGQSGQVTRILTLVRGAFAEALYLKEVKTVAPPLAPDSDKMKAFLDEETDFSSLRAKQDSTLAIAAACMVAAQPGVAQKLLESRHGSDEEKGLMDALFREAPTCAGEHRPAGISLAFLRAFVAEAAYRYQLYAVPKEG